jgi:hypothetical protein
LQFDSGVRAATRTNLGLGATNTVTFGTVEISNDEMLINGSSIQSGSFGGTFDFEERRLLQGETAIFSYSSNSATVSVPATFSTNVSIAGSLTVGSFTTTTPSTWALDATQTAAATNGVLTLPSNANVIRLTNNNAISSVTNGVLGAFYYLVNQATNAVTISNVGGITIDGAQNLTLSPNESATLVATGPTNVSVANRGDLTDVALGGTANTAPSQTASSGSSLMTRELTDNNPLWALGSVRPMGAFAFGNSGAPATSAESVTRGGATVTTGTNTNGYGRASLYQGINDATSFSGQGIRFTQSITASAILSTLPRTNGVVRLIVGGNGGVPAAANADALAVRGFGVEFEVDPSGFKMRLFAHNGTSYTNSAYTAGIANSSVPPQHVIISSQTNGVISLYHSIGVIKSPPRPSTTPLLTLSGGPTSGVGGAYVDLVAVTASNTATPTQAAALFYNGMLEVKD